MIPRPLVFQVLICNFCLCLFVNTSGTGDLPDGRWIAGSSLSSLPEAAASVRFGEKGLDPKNFSASVCSVLVLIVVSSLLATK